MTSHLLRRGSRSARQVRSMGLFILLPALSTAAPLAVIPAVTAVHGADGWSVVALALAVGSAGLVIAELGWGVVGPQSIASDPHGRYALYERALASRLLACCVVAPAAVTLTSLLVGHDRLAAGLVTFGVVTSALSPSWFFVGTGRPGLILLCETLPKVFCALASAGIILAGGPLVVYGAGLLAASCMTYLLAVVVGGTAAWPSRAAVSSAPSVVARQGIVILGRGISTVYTALPVALLGLVDATSVAAFSAADRPSRAGLGIVGAVPARLQSWIGNPDPDVKRRRSRLSLAINCAVGAAAGVIAALALPPVAQILFSATIAVEPALALISGALVWVICTSRGFGLALIAADAANKITVAIAGAAAVGVLAVPLGGHLLGATGTMLGVFVAECVGLLVQARLLVRAWAEDDRCSAAGADSEMLTC